MNAKRSSNVPRGSYHWVLMTIYDILEQSNGKDFITTREVVEKHPVLRESNNERDPFDKKRFRVRRGLVQL